MDYKLSIEHKQVVLYINGVKVKFIYNGSLSSRLCKGHKHELFEIEFIEKYLKDDFVFVDIGAGIGYYSVILKLLKPSITVYGFEPCKNTYNTCLENIKLNELQDVIINQIALSNYKGKGVLKLHEQDGLNTLGKPFVESKYLGQEKAEVSTLDLFIKENNIKQVDVIKVDVEGGELRVFQGATKLLNRGNAPLVLFENVKYRTKAFGHSPLHVEGFLQSFGYEIKQISSEMFVARKGE